jgi:hypothetical protein
MPVPATPVVVQQLCPNVLAELNRKAERPAQGAAATE